MEAMNNLMIPKKKFMVFNLCMVDLYITTCIEKILHMSWICQIYVKMVNNHESRWINTQMW
jgi:hypothetical protein